MCKNANMQIQTQTSKYKQTYTQHTQIHTTHTNTHNTHKYTQHKQIHITHLHKHKHAHTFSVYTTDNSQFPTYTTAHKQAQACAHRGVALFLWHTSTHTQKQKHTGRKDLLASEHKHIMWLGNHKRDHARVITEQSVTTKHKHNVGVHSSYLLSREIVMSVQIYDDKFTMDLHDDHKFVILNKYTMIITLLRMTNLRWL